MYCTSLPGLDPFEKINFTCLPSIFSQMYVEDSGEDSGGLGVKEALFGKDLGHIMTEWIPVVSQFQPSFDMSKK